MKTVATLLGKLLLPKTTGYEVTEIYLAASEVWSGTTMPRAQIVCERGIVWLTQPNDLHDYILHPSQRFLTTGRGEVVVQALTAATITVIGPEEQPSQSSSPASSSSLKATSRRLEMKNHTCCSDQEKLERLFNKTEQNPIKSCKLLLVFTRLWQSLSKVFEVNDEPTNLLTITAWHRQRTSRS